MNTVQLPHSGGTQPTALPEADWREEMARVRPGEPSLRRIAMASMLTIVLGFGGLTTWAATATLDSAVGAPGVFVSAGKRKTLSILDPGILKAMDVHEGEKVEAGQIILELDDVQARASREQARLKLWGVTARVERLRAEAADSHELAFSAPVMQQAASDPAIASQVAAEHQQFESRWRTYEDLLKVGAQHLAQAQGQVPVLQAQEDSLSTRVALTRKEQANMDGLYAQHLIARENMVNVHISTADLSGQLAQVQGQLIVAKSAIQQAHQEIEGAVSGRHTDISKDLGDAEATRVDAVQGDRIAADMLERRVLRASEAGIVTDMKLFTPGGSIGAGQPILDLVPADSSLLIEASVAPNDIEHVAVGQKVNVRLTAYKAHRVPVITGRLVYVAADRTMDPANQPVFLARAQIDPGQLEKLDHVAVYAGMPADVLIIGGQRSVLDFLISPIKENLRHGMHEE
jgi:HlyD family secretion protein